MAVHALIVHQIPGRIRMRIPEKRGDDDYFSRLFERLSGVDAVRNVKVNPATASVVIEFGHGLTELIENIRQHEGDLEIQQLPSEKPSAFSPAILEMDPPNIVSGRAINPMFMTASLLAVIGIVQTLRGQILVPSVSMFWYALETFRQSGKGQ
jgi:hypothetical protein